MAAQTASVPGNRPSPSGVQTATSTERLDPTVLPSPTDSAYPDPHFSVDSSQPQGRRRKGTTTEILNLADREAVIRHLTQYQAHRVKSRSKRKPKQAPPTDGFIDPFNPPVNVSPSQQQPGNSLEDATPESILAILTSPALSAAYNFLHGSVRQQPEVLSFFYLHWREHSLYWDKMLVGDEMRAFSSRFDDCFRTMLSWSDQTDTSKSVDWSESRDCDDGVAASCRASRLVEGQADGGQLDKKVTALYRQFERLLRTVRVSELARMPVGRQCRRGGVLASGGVLTGDGERMMTQWGDCDTKTELSVDAVDRFRRAVLGLRFCMFTEPVEKTRDGGEKDDANSAIDMKCPLAAFTTLTIEHDRLVGSGGESRQSRRWNGHLSWLSDWAEEEEARQLLLSSHSRRRPSGRAVSGSSGGESTKSGGSSGSTTQSNNGTGNPTGATTDPIPVGLRVRSGSELSSNSTSASSPEAAGPPIPPAATVIRTLESDLKAACRVEAVLAAYPSLIPVLMNDLSVELSESFLWTILVVTIVLFPAQGEKIRTNIVEFERGDEDIRLDDDDDLDEPSDEDDEDSEEQRKNKRNRRKRRTRNFTKPSGEKPKTEVKGQTGPRRSLGFGKRMFKSVRDKMPALLLSGSSKSRRRSSIALAFSAVTSTAAAAMVKEMAKERQDQFESAGRANDKSRRKSESAKPRDDQDEDDDEDEFDMDRTGREGEVFAYRLAGLRDRFEDVKAELLPVWRERLGWVLAIDSGQAGGTV